MKAKLNSFIIKFIIVASIFGIVYSIIIPMGIASMRYSQISNIKIISLGGEGIINWSDYWVEKINNQINNPNWYKSYKEINKWEAEAITFYFKNKKVTTDIQIAKLSRNSKYFNKYTPIIVRTSIKYKLDHKLVSAVIKTESNFKPSVISPVGAIGLMPLMPATAKDMGVEDPFDPNQNIEGGIKYLRYLIDRFEGNLTLALAAYNSGPKNVEKYGDVPPFKETKKYVKKVYKFYEIYASSK